MTPPRPICPGNTHFITRRISQRMFLLRPRPIVEQAFLYVSAIAAEKFNVEVHAIIVMSNHWHALLTDREANLPRFYKYVHMYVAKILNCEIGRFEGMWSTEKTSVVTLTEDVDILDKLTYIMANPVAGQLVQRGKDWPGLRRMWQDRNASVTVVRPEKFYRDDGDMPAEVTLTFSRPPVLSSLNDAAASKEFGRLLRKQEKMERKRIANKNGRYMGVFAILKQRLTATPQTYAKKFGLSPRVGGINKWARIEALMRLKSWYQEYQEAYDAWREGDEAEFPFGTYQLKHQASIRCADAPMPE